LGRSSGCGAWKNSSNTRSISSGDMPMPLSQISTASRRSWRLAWMVT
jgi:hypothetical protein